MNEEMWRISDNVKKAKGLREEFKDFCNEYNLTYDFTYFGYGFADSHTGQAFICWKYGRGIKK